MKNKVILITGATSGIGKAAAGELAKMGATIVLTYRNKKKGEATLEEIRKESGSNNLHMLEVDLASLESVRKLAENYKKQFSRLDVLVNNAGGFFGYRKTTEDGFEYTLGVNHLGHFLLTNLLKDVLIANKARIINVSSEIQRAGKIYFEDLMLEKDYSGMKAYSQAKLTNIMFSYELNQRWGESGITVNALHPGAVATNFGNEAKPVFRVLMKIGKPFLKTPEQGADTLVYLASSPEVEDVSGQYFSKRKPIKSNTASYNQEDWKRLWEISEGLTGLN